MLIMVNKKMVTMVYGRYNELVNGDYFMVYKATNLLVGGDWNHGIWNGFPETVGNKVNNWRSPSFFRGVGLKTTNQIICQYINGGFCKRGMYSTIMGMQLGQARLSRSLTDGVSSITKEYPGPRSKRLMEPTWGRNQVELRYGVLCTPAYHEACRQ